MFKSFGVYQFKNKVTNKTYVGSTTRSFKHRKAQHLLNLCRNKGNPCFQAAWNKYGAEAFEFSVLEVVEDKLKVLEREQYWIDTLKPEYNICPIAGSSLGTKRSEGTKKKLSESHKGNPGYWIGKSLSEETKKKIGEANKGNKNMLGKKHSGEAKKKMSEALRGEKHPNYGKHPSEETKKKMSEKAKNRRSSRKGALLSEKTKKKISDANKGKKRTEETILKLRERSIANPSRYWAGRTRSEETKRKIRETKKGKKLSEENKI